MDMLTFFERIRTPELAIEFLRERNILRSIPPRCITCRRPMTEVKDNSYRYDGLVWRCPKHKGNKRSIRAGSCFENTNISAQNIVQLAYCWALSIPSTTMEILCALSKSTVIEYNSFFRSVCTRWLVENPIRLGGIGHVVQIG